jgi:uracil-DNA glycosylase family 4
LLHHRVTACTTCARLRSYCADVGVTRRAAYREWHYWTKPVPGFGDPRARLWIIGLAPGAHGANRTGRIFTGDRSGDFLYAALHRAGFANQPTSVSRDDGLRLTDCYISAAARCAPPDNKPSPAEIAACADFLDEEWRLLTRKRVILALGKIAWDAASGLARRHVTWPSRPSAGRWGGKRSGEASKPRVHFAHAAACDLGPGLTLIGSYHVSQQNTFTGRLTPAMFDAVLRVCRETFDARGSATPAARTRRSPGS